MTEHGLTMESLLSALPAVLRKNPRLCAIAKLFAAKIVELDSSLDELRIYPRIELLPEKLLDILAKDFKVDWWDPDYTLEEKRRTLQDSWRVHRMLGTKKAVETALSAIYPGARVFEWTAYDGEPYHYRLSINASEDEISSEKHQRVLERVGIFGNLRSVLDEVEYYDASALVTVSVGAVAAGCEITDGARAV